jgi:purine-binding chemotaxis protein CheW
VRHVLFKLEKDTYAIPLGAVREVVVPPQSFTKVPRSPAPVRGVMNLRGRVVTVVELRALLGLGPGGNCAKVVLLDRGRAELGLLVTEVQGIEVIERVNPAPGKPEAAVRGVARLGGLAVTVLDPDGVDARVGELFGSK